MATLGGTEIHFVHQRSASPSALPLILTHGWPGSFIEMERILPLLTDPAAHGGNAADAFHVVVPSLPGFGFSPAPAAVGVSSKQIAQQWHSLMAELGYPVFAAQGGDIGAGVSMWLARQFPQDVLGIHLNYIPASYRPPLNPSKSHPTEEEQAYLQRASVWTATEGAYAAMHGTKPQTLAWVERVFDVRRWTSMPGGGHFAALEQPDLLVREIREFFRPFRQQLLRPASARID